MTKLITCVPVKISSLLFQAESVIMTFQFHPENIPFFRCLRAQTSSSSEQNIKKFSAGSAEVPSVMNDIVGAMLW